MRSVHWRGSITTANLTQDKFLASSEVIDSNFFERDSRAELKNQYREYVRQMQDLASSKPKVMKFSDMELLELTLMPENKEIYGGVESVISVMVQASLVISVESVVKSWISILEHHSSQLRNIGELLLHKDMVIAVNGPSVENCEVN